VLQSFEGLKELYERVSNKEKVFLTFSGGRTRKTAKQVSEALSYYEFLQDFFLSNFSKLSFLNIYKIWNLSKNDTSILFSKVILEEYARDSYENLLFSLCLFNNV
jgi:hypothetical protein